MADADDLILLNSGHKDLQGCDLSAYSTKDRIFLGVDFRRANLSNSVFTRCNFEGCQFGSATLQSTDFSSSRFVGCSFDSDHIRVKFDDVVFEGGELRGLIISCSFENATFVGVRAKDILFGDNNTLSNAYAERSSDFQGARMPRALSKASLFSGYRFEGGALVREELRDNITIEQQLQVASEVSRLARSNVTVVLRTNTASALVTSLSLVSLIDDYIENIPTPNDPEKLDFHQHYIELLAKVRVEAEFISSCLSDDSGDRSIKEATEAVLTVRELVQDWWISNGAKAIDYGANVGLIGVGTAFLSFCGAPPTMATAICAILGGSKALSEYISRTSKND